MKIEKKKFLAGMAIVILALIAFTATQTRVTGYEICYEKYPLDIGEYVLYFLPECYCVMEKTSVLNQKKEYPHPNHTDEFARDYTYVVKKETRFPV